MLPLDPPLLLPGTEWGSRLSPSPCPNTLGLALAPPQPQPPSPSPARGRVGPSESGAEWGRVGRVGPSRAE